MKILIIGYGFYVMGDKNCKGGTILPAAYSWCAQNPTSSIDIFARDNSAHKANKRLSQYLNNNNCSDFSLNIVSEMSKEYDAAIIAAPEAAHLDILTSIPHIKNIMCVKPVGANFSDYKEMCKVTNKNNQKFYVDFHKRFDPANVAIMNEIKSSNDSKYFFSFSYGQKKEMIEEYFIKWFDNSNPFQYLGPHYLDIILFSTGLLDKDIKIHCKAEAPLKDKSGVPLFVFGMINIASEDKEVSIAFDCNWYEPNSMPYSSRQRIEGFSESLRFISEQDNRGLIFWNDDVSIPNPHYRTEALSDAWGYGVDIYKRFLQSVSLDKHDVFLPNIYDYNNVAAIVETVNKKIYEKNK